MLYEIFKVQLAEDIFQPEEIHSNCEKAEIGGYQICEMIKNHLTCSQSKCGGDSYRCSCHIINDMGGYVLFISFQLEKTKTGDLIR